MTNFPHFYVKKSIIKKFFLAHQEKFGKYDLKNSFGKYYISSNDRVPQYCSLSQLENQDSPWKTRIIEMQKFILC